MNVSDKGDCVMEILLVEDNPGDIFMVREALEESGLAHRVHVVNNGVQALDFLRRHGPDGKAPVDLIILDLNLPAKPGREVMAELQACPRMRRLPVAVLSTSRSERNICQAFPQLRSTFAMKTPDPVELVRILQDFVRFARSE